MAKGGPSPLIPLVLVVSLGLLLGGNSISGNLINLPSATDAENAVLNIIVFIPVLVVLALYSATHAILLPIALVLVTYTVATTLLGPLMLIFILYLGCAFLPSFAGNNGEEFGWGCVLLLAFFLLHWILSDEGRQSGALLLALVIFICYHFAS